MKASSSRSPRTTKATRANAEVVNKELPEDYYVVEGIRKKRVVQGQLQYLIKWLDWPESANTWEPVESLNELCQELIDDFEQSMATGNRMKPSRKHKRRRTTSTPKKKPHQLPAKEPISVPSAEPTDTCGAVDNVSMEDVLENIEGAMNEEDNHNVPDAPNEEPVESSKQHKEAKRRKSIPVSRFVADPERPGPVRLKPVRPKIMRFRPPSSKPTEASSSRITSTKSHNIPDAQNEEPVQKSKLKGAKRRKSGPVASSFQRTAVMMGADNDALVKPSVSSNFQAIPLQTSCRPSQASSSGIGKPSGAVDKGRATMRQKQVEKEVNHGSRSIEVDHHTITSESPEKSGRNLIDAFTECMSMCKGKRSQRNHMREKTTSEKTQQLPARESIPVPRMDLTHPYAAVEKGRKRKTGPVDTAVTQANADDVNIVEEAGNDRNQHNVPVESEKSCQHHIDAFREISVWNHKLGKRIASKKKNPTREAIPVPRMKPTHPSEAVEKGKGTVKADQVDTVVNQGNTDDVCMEGVLPETQNIIEKAANDGNQHNVPVESEKSCQRYIEAFKESVATSKDKKSVRKQKLGKKIVSKKKKPAREAIPVTRMEPIHPSKAAEKGKGILKADQGDPVVNQGNVNNACMEDVLPETQNIAPRGTNELYQDNVPDASNEKPIVTRDQARLSQVQLLEQNHVQKDVQEKASASSNHKPPDDASNQLTPLHGSTLPPQSSSSGIRAPLNHEEEETLDLNVALDREGKPIDLNMELQVGEETMAEKNV